MLIDERIGTYTGEEPMLCAVSGQPVRGRPSSQYPLDKAHYYRVLAKAEPGFDGAPRQAKEAELKAVIAANTPAVEVEPAASKRVKAKEDGDVRSE